MNNRLLVITITAAFIFSGCINPTNNEEISENNELDDWTTHYVNSVNDLPFCIDDTHGRLYYISDTDSFQACTDFGWISCQKLSVNAYSCSNLKDITMN